MCLNDIRYNNQSQWQWALWYWTKWFMTNINEWLCRKQFHFDKWYNKLDKVWLNKIDIKYSNFSKKCLTWLRIVLLGFWISWKAWVCNYIVQSIIILRCNATIQIAEVYLTFPNCASDSINFLYRLFTYWHQRMNT